MSHQPNMAAATPEQLRVLKAYLDAGSAKGAAHLLGMTNQAVRRRMMEMYRATGARNAADAAYWLGRQQMLLD